MKSNDFSFMNPSNGLRKGLKMINNYAPTIAQSPVSANLADAIAAARNRIAAAAKDLSVKLQHRQTMKRFERFSDHSLQDVGFERDWDGSIQPHNR